MMREGGCGCLGCGFGEEDGLVEVVGGGGWPLLIRALERDGDGYADREGEERDVVEGRVTWSCHCFNIETSVFTC